MESFETLVVGSGPAGVAAARRLAGRGACIVDIGAEAVVGFPFASLAEALVAGSVRDLLGPHWEMLGNLAEPLAHHPKVRGGALSHVLSGDPFDVFGEGGQLLVTGHGSAAAGGMANIWGGQLMRFTAADLAAAGDWPISASELAPYYADLEEEIGLSGEDDDMASYFGPVSALMAPPPLVPAAAHLMRRYQGRRVRRVAGRLLLGRPRLAVLTRRYRERAAYPFGETEFFTCGHAGIYTPTRTLLELAASGSVTYLRGLKAGSFAEHADHVELAVEDMASGAQRVLRARHLLIACGTVQTARLVLKSRGKPGVRLPFLDHPPTLVPLFMPSLFGRAVTGPTFPVQLAATLGAGSGGAMISLYYPGGMLWSDLLPDVPLPINVARAVLGAVMGGMLVAQIWSVSRPQSAQRLVLGADGRVRIDYPQPVPWPALPSLLAELRALGCFSQARLASAAPPGWGFHHAGTLPMRRQPAAYECHTDGRLWDSARVRVIDASLFPSLPAKNISLTIMANAARIADLAGTCGY